MSSKASSGGFRWLSVTARVLLTLAAVLLLILLTAYLFRVELLVHAGNRFLQPYELRISDMDGFRFSRRDLQIDELQISDASDRRVFLENLTANFSLSQLFGGRIDSLHIAALRLELPGTLPVDPDPSAWELPEIRLRDVMGSLQDLPVERLVIDAIDAPPFLHKASLQLSRTSRDLQLQMLSAELRLVASINWHNREFVSSYFLDSDQLQQDMSQEALTAELHLHDGSTEIVGLELSLHESMDSLKLQAGLTIDVATASAVLADQFALPQDLPGLEGQLRALLEIERDSPAADSLRYTVTIVENSRLEISGLGAMFADAGSSVQVVEFTDDLVISGDYPPTANSLLELSSNRVSIRASALPQLDELQLDELQLGLSQLQMQCRTLSDCNSRQHIELRAPLVAAADLELTGLHFAGDAVLSHDNGSTQLQLQPGFDLSVESLKAAALSLSLPQLSSETVITARFNGTTASIEGGRMHLALPLIALDNSISRINIQIPAFRLNQDSELSIHAEFLALEAASELLPIQLSSAIMEGELTLTGPALSLEAALHLHGQYALDMTLEHHLETGVGSGRFTMPGIHFDTLWSRLSNFLTPMPVDADLLAGSISGNAELAWQADQAQQWQLSGPVALQLQGLSGNYGEIGFLDASTALSMEVLPELQVRTSGRQHFTLQQIDPGMPIEDIRFDYAVDSSQGRYTLENLRANIFNGVVASDGLDYRPDAEVNQMLLELERIDLAQVLSLAAYDAVTASGLLSGQLPVSLSNGQVSVNNGNMFALSPGGHISYRPQTGAASSGNASLDLVYQALSNYQYQLLQTTVDYTPEGELLLAVRLEGINPDMGPAGQRINLNLNISDNIPALLQSLQAGRSITDAIEAQLQSQ